MTISNQVEFSRRQPSNDFIPRLWAARKAGILTAYLQTHGPDRETIEEIRRLGLRFGILTDYTSYLVEEPQAAQLSVDELASRLRSERRAPAEQTGFEAFQRAKHSSDLEAVERLGDADAALSAIPTSGVRADAGGGSDGSVLRTVRDRLFVLRNGVWTDLRSELGFTARGSKDPSITIRVATFGAAYFELLRRAPTLAAYFAIGTRVLIAGDGLNLEISEEGRSRLTIREIDRILHALTLRPAG